MARPPLTHFLCLPLVTSTSRPILEKSLSKFKGEVLGRNVPGLNDMKTPGIDDGMRAAGINDGIKDSSSRNSSNENSIGEGVFRPLGTMHLTIGVMSLDRAKLDEACSVLDRLDLGGLFEDSSLSYGDDMQTGNDDTTEPQRPDSKPMNSPIQNDKTTVQGDASLKERAVEPLTLSLYGVQPMHSPESTSILYSPPIDGTNRLYTFASRLKQIFTTADLLIPDDRPLKLHATIINTVYGSPRRQNEANHRNRGRKSRPGRFDARPLIEEFADYEFAQNITVEKIAICRMGAVKVRDGNGVIIEEKYEEVASRDIL